MIAAEPRTPPGPPPPSSSSVSSSSLRKRKAMDWMQNLEQSESESESESEAKAESESASESETEVEAESESDVVDTESRSASGLDAGGNDAMKATRVPENLDGWQDTGTKEGVEPRPRGVLSGLLTAKDILATSEDIRVSKDAAGRDVYIYDPFNARNQEITAAEVTAILRTYGVHLPIKNLRLYQRAFVNKSYLRHPLALNERNQVVTATQPATCAVGLYSKSNERLEFIGDGVLECFTKWYLYQRFPKEREGFMTEKKIALVKNEAIGKIAQEMGLHRWLILSRQAEQKDMRNNLKKLGCLFEAFLGALFLDFNSTVVHDRDHLFDRMFLTGPGFQVAQIFVEHVFDRHVDWMNLIRNDDNYKNALQVLIQKEFKTTPEYLVTSTSGGSHHHHSHHHSHHPRSSSSTTESNAMFRMAVYVCVGQHVHGLKHQDSVPLSQFSTFLHIHQHVAKYGKIFLFLGEGSHRIKKKAEQIASQMAVVNLQPFLNPPSSSSTSVLR